MRDLDLSDIGLIWRMMCTEYKNSATNSQLAGVDSCYGDKTLVRGTLLVYTRGYIIDSRLKWLHLSYKHDNWLLLAALDYRIAARQESLSFVSEVYREAIDFAWMSFKRRRQMSYCHSQNGFLDGHEFEHFLLNLPMAISKLRCV